MAMQRAGEQRGEGATKGLVERLLEVGSQLARTELEKARGQVRGELRQALKGAAMLGGAGVMTLGALGVLLVASVQRKVPRARPGRTAVLGLGLLGGAAGLSWVGLQALPRHPVAALGEQVRRDVERVAEVLT